MESSEQQDGMVGSASLPADQCNSSSKRSEEQPDISVEVMALDDLRTTLKWGQMEGWNPGDGDAEVFFTADKNGFFMAKTVTGEHIASVSGVRYDDNYGFIGLYICVPEQRGKGYGKSTFGYAIRHLEGRVIGLDALEAQRSNYAKWGFVVAHENIRFGGVVDLGALPQAPLPTGEGGEHVVIKDVDQDLVGAILEFDEKHVAAPRELFLRAWLSAPGHLVRAAIIGNNVKGYGVLRPSCDGPRIGPVFAESVEVADLLMRALVAQTSENATVFIDVPAPNQASIELVGRLGLTKMWSAFRMYRGPAPELPLERIYGMTTLELG